MSTTGSRRIAIAAFGTLLAAAAAGCGKHSEAGTGGRGGAVPVTVAAAEAKAVPVTVRSIGTVEAYNTVSVRSQVSGTLERVAFREGQDVKAGEALFTIDRRPYEAALEAALSDSARSAALAASATAQAGRYRDLVEKDYVTRQEFDDVTASADAALASLRGAEAEARTARLDLEYCDITSPLSGRTGSLLVHAGNLVRANDTEALVVIQQIVPVRVSFSVPEGELAAIRRASASSDLVVRAHVSGDSSTAREGKLTFLDNAVDESTGTILLKATFDNRDEALWPGQFVDVDLVLATREDAVVVPVRALQLGQDGDFVYLVQEDGTARQQPVTVGARVGDEVVIEQGVSPADRVVTDGQLRLFPGAKVAETGAGPPAAAS